MTISLKHLLAVCIAAVLFAILSACLIIKWQVDRAIAEIENLNGAVGFQGGILFGPEQATFALMGREQIIDDPEFQRLLPYLQHLRSLRSLDLSGTTLTPDALNGIDKLTALTRLELPAHCISEESIPAVVSLKRLEVLYVYGSDTPAATIERLRRMLPTTKIHVKTSRWSQPIP